MKKTYLIYNLLAGLCYAFILQGCSKENELEDYGKVPPTIQITTPTTGMEIERNRIDHTVTVSGTLTGTNLTSLSYVLNDGTAIEVPDFDGSSPDFTFDLDFSALNEGDQPLTATNNAFSQELTFADLLPGESKSVTLTINAKDAIMEPGSKSITFTVKIYWIYCSLYKNC